MRGQGFFGDTAEEATERAQDGDRIGGAAGESGDHATQEVTGSAARRLPKNRCPNRTRAGRGQRLWTPGLGRSVSAVEAVSGKRRRRTAVRTVIRTEPGKKNGARPPLFGVFVRVKSRPHEAHHEPNGENLGCPQEVNRSHARFLQPAAVSPPTSQRDAPAIAGRRITR